MMNEPKNNKPKAVEIVISKEKIVPIKDDERMKARHSLLEQIKGMALKDMKERLDSTKQLDSSIDSEMDKAPSTKSLKDVESEEGCDDMEDSGEDMQEMKDSLSKLPEHPEDSKKERLVSLLKEMEDLKERVRQILED